MLFKVEMTVNIPASLPKVQVDEIKAKEKPIRNGYSAKANGCISGGWWGNTPTSASLTLPTIRSCTRY